MLFAADFNRRIGRRRTYFDCCNESLILDAVEQRGLQK
jgi:hypothetical protein